MLICKHHFTVSHGLGPVGTDPIGEGQRRVISVPLVRQTLRQT